MRRLIGIHAVAAAVRSAPGPSSDLERVIVAKSARNSRLQAVIDDCRKAGIPLRFEPKTALRRIAGTSAHQNVVAILAAQRYQTLEDVLENAGDQSTVVILDSVQDPHNLGAIIRSSDGAGAAAVVLPERRSASLTEAAAKAASGSLESVPVVRVKNLGRALERLKGADFWIYGFDAESGVDYDTVEYPERCALVMGGESRGLRQKVAERCDFLVRIPLAGTVSSLNVSVAAGIALFEIGRQRRSQRRQAARASAAGEGA